MPDTPRSSLLLAGSEKVAGAFLLAAALMAPAATSKTRHIEACLSVSPLRALDRTGRGDARDPRALTLRDALVAALRPRLEARGRMVVRPAGQCPAGMPVLDLFQNLTDVPRRDQGTALRLEWRHMPGERRLDVSDLPESDNDIPIAWVDRVVPVADSAIWARLEVTSAPPDARLRTLGDGRDLGRTPVTRLEVPGVLHLEARLPRHNPLAIHSRLRPGQTTTLELALSPRPPPILRPWHVWAMTAVATVATGVAHRHVSRSYERYASLGPDDPDQAFPRAWRSVQQAQILRGGLAVTTAVFGSFALVLELEFP